MFKWLKKLFGTDLPETVIIADEPSVSVDEPKVEQTKPVAKPKAQAKKPATKKTATKANLDTMSKNDLLAHAKKNGIKANASMKKADILAAIKNG
jgi:hypothetical protein